MQVTGAVVCWTQRDTCAWSRRRGEVPRHARWLTKKVAGVFHYQVRSASVMNGDCVKLPLAAVVTSDHQGWPATRRSKRKAVMP